MQRREARQHCKLGSDNARDSPQKLFSTYDCKQHTSLPKASKCPCDQTICCLAHTAGTTQCRAIILCKKNRPASAASAQSATRCAVHNVRKACRVPPRVPFTVTHTPAYLQEVIDSTVRTSPVANWRTAKRRTRTELPCCVVLRLNLQRRGEVQEVHAGR